MTLGSVLLADSVASTAAPPVEDQLEQTNEQAREKSRPEFQITIVMGIASGHGYAAPNSSIEGNGTALGIRTELSGKYWSVGSTIERTSHSTGYHPNETTLSLTYLDTFGKLHYAFSLGEGRFIMPQVGLGYSIADMAFVQPQKSSNPIAIENPSPAISSVTITQPNAAGNIQGLLYLVGIKVSPLSGLTLGANYQGPLLLHGNLGYEGNDESNRNLERISLGVHLRIMDRAWIGFENMEIKLRQGTEVGGQQFYFGSFAYRF